MINAIGIRTNEDESVGVEFDDIQGSVELIHITEIFTISRDPINSKKIKNKNFIYCYQEKYINYYLDKRKWDRFTAVCYLWKCIGQFSIWN